MISLSRCPHAGQTIVDGTAAIDPSRCPGRAASTQEDRLEGSARPPILASMSRGYDCPFRLKSSHMAALAGLK